MTHPDPSGGAELAAIVRFVQAVDQPVDQSPREIAERLNELRRNGDPSLLEASCLGHTVYLNPSLILAVIAA